MNYICMCVGGLAAGKCNMQKITHFPVDSFNLVYILKTGSVSGYQLNLKDNTFFWL